jgi:predicted nuclease of predicted toxin-antitoxin system
MRWLVDECVDASLITLLRQIGHDVVYVPDITPRAADSELMRFADSENRLLLTEDKDFGDLVFRQAMRVPGIVLLRIEPAQRSLKGPRLRAAIDQLGDSLLGRYTVVEVARLRSRPVWPR